MTTRRGGAEHRSPEVGPVSRQPGFLELPFDPVHAACRRVRPLPGFLEQKDRVQGEQDREADRPTVEIALDHRATAKWALAAADAERTRKTRILARVHQHQEDQADRDENLDNREDRFHGPSVASFASERAPGRPIRPGSGLTPRASVQSGRSPAVVVSMPIHPAIAPLDRNSDYESFTKACFSADMNCVRGALGALGALRQTRPWDETTMSRGHLCQA